MMHIVLAALAKTIIQTTAFLCILSTSAYGRLGEVANGRFGALQFAISGFG
jgi:hypothetical protein